MIKIKEGKVNMAHGMLGERRETEKGFDVETSTTCTT
jgi:hypothetical protein